MTQKASLSSLAQRLAGQNAYEKGVQLYEGKKVSHLQFTSHSVSAQVLGTKLYQVDLTRVGESFDGGCSCPASEGFDFCKHCVAVLLEYSDKTQQFEDMKNGPPAQRVQAYISQLSEQDAKNAMYQIISDSPELFEHWLLIADISSSKLQAADLKKYFTKALPLKDVWKHAQVRAYFEKSFSQLSRLYEAIHLLEPSQRFNICEFALQRYDKILERIDDSAGYRLTIFHLIERSFADAFKATAWSIDEKASYLVDLYNTSYNHIAFESIPEKFIHEDDSALMQAFYTTLKRVIDAKLNAKSELKTSQSLVLKQMCKQLIEHYQATNQQASALLYLTQTAENLDDYGQVIELAIESEQLTIANEFIKIALNKCRMHEDKTKIERLAFKSMMQAKQYKEALRLAWNIFETTCKMDDFKCVETLSYQQKNSKAVLEKKAETLLRNRAGMNSAKSSKVSSNKAVESLVEFYLHTRKTDKALSLVKQHELPPDIVHDVAFSSLAVRPKASFNLYRQLALLYPQLGGAQDFESCIELLSELQLGIKHDDDLLQKFSHLLAELSEIFRHKSAFIARLNASFPDRLRV